MTAVKRDLYIEQGATFKLGFNWHRESTVTPGTAGDPYDITGCIVRMQIRKAQKSNPLLVDASTTNGKITIDGPAGRIDLLLGAEDTDLLIHKSSLYDLELEFTTGPETGNVYRLLEGSVTVSPNITQETDDPVVGA